MTKDQCGKLVERYKYSLDSLSSVQVISCDYDFDKKPRSIEDILCHCRSMLDQMEKFLDESDVEKFMRWLGFLQGCFWVQGLYTLDEMRNHNKEEAVND